MIINPISKGGKGLLPEIIVTAPSGSTLDLMQGSVVLQTYALSSTETQHTFIVKSIGTYTVRGTSGSDSASVEVVVDVVGQYSCTIEYRSQLYLYNLGDECEDVSGGWHLFWNYDNTATFKKNADHLYLSAQRSPGVGGEGAIGTNNKISLKGFSELHYEITQNSNTETKLYHSTKQTSDTYGFPSYCTKMTDGISGEYTSEEVTVQLSDYQDINNYLVFRMLWYTGSGLVELKIHKVWLE